MRILVVDDDESLRLLLELHLANAGHEVVLAADGIEAGHAILRDLPDLMIVDVNMPYLSGVELVRVVKRDPEVCRLPVLFLTAEDELDGETMALAEGYLTKPVMLATLLGAVSSIARPASLARRRAA